MSLVTTSRDRCRDFINKVRARSINIKNRQVNKFNRLVTKCGNDRNNNSRERNAYCNKQPQASSNNCSNYSSNNNNNQLQPSNTKNKWVINLSNIPLTPAQESLLAKGPIFAVAHKNPPNVDYIAAIESVCQKLTEQDAEELRADINGLLRRAHAPKPNLNKAEVKALAKLKGDKDRIILTAKGWQWWS